MSVPSRHTDIPQAAWSTTLGDLCDRFGGEIQTGPFGSQLHASDYSQNGVPVVMPQDLIDARIVCDRIARVSHSIARSLSRHALRSGDVVFSRRGDVTRFAVVTDEEQGWLCGTGCIRIRLNCPNVSIPYLRNYLQQDSTRNWLMHEAKGVTMPNLNTQIVRALPFVYPPLEEQRRIAATLDQAEALGAKRRQALAKLDTLTQSLFLEMFGDLSRKHSFEVLALGKVCDVRDGTHASPPYHVSGYPLVTSKNLREGVVDLEGAKYISEADYIDISRRSRVHLGDILMPMIGTIGNPVLVTEEPNYAVKNVAIIKFTARSPSRRYIQALLTGPYFDHVTRQKKRGGTQGFLALGDIRSLPIPLPDPEQQKSFEERALAIIENRKWISQSASSLDILFSSLQHRAFRGEL